MRAPTHPLQPDPVSEETATLDGLFRSRAQRTPGAVAYREFDEQRGQWRDWTWAAMEREIARWQQALERERLAPGDRVAVMLRNGVAWILFDQAALGLGLVVVPVYTSDRPDNVAYVLHDSGAKLLLIEGIAQWQALSEVKQELAGLARIVSLQPLGEAAGDGRLVAVGEWLPEKGGKARHLPRDGAKLATIVYTSGTTGRPKGVMLSHDNILSNVRACLQLMPVTEEDVFLSFLPLSHTLERTVGYYLTVMAGATVAFVRSVSQLAEDLQSIRPTLLVSVPRIYERVYSGIRAKLEEGPPLKRRLFELAVSVGYSRFEHRQGRAPWHPAHLFWPLLRRLVADKVLAKLGGRMRAGICGGAALSPEIAQVFIGLGLPVLQGYGLTETSPVVSVNRLQDNVPASVGAPIPGVEVRLGERDALLVRGPNVMLGYWNNPDATRAVIDSQGWLNTGDTARIDQAGRIYITGRLKEIIVLSTGEKISPVDMESAILRDPLFEQVMLIGEGRPYLSVLAVLNSDRWEKLARESGIGPSRDALLGKRQAEEIVLERIARQTKSFPGYAQIRRAALTLEPWTVENGFLTPTLKVKRGRVLEAYRREVERLYEGH